MEELYTLMLEKWGIRLAETKYLALYLRGLARSCASLMC